MFEVKFAVVREDPRVEEKLVQHAQANTILLVGSGGCTALHLKHTMPSLEVVAYDFNPEQLAHIRRKAEAVAKRDLSLLNVEDARTDGLNQCGAFEQLFRVLQATFLEFVASAEEVKYFFYHASSSERSVLVEKWFQSKYWPSVFAAVFNDTLLHAMFGPDATQHAAPGSYPGYFQSVIERGFRCEDAAQNPFLQHIFLGFYKASDAPSYVHAGQPLELILREGALPAISDIERFDIVHLSNIFDWGDDSLVRDWLQHLQHMKPGSWLITRQLNNERPLHDFFQGFFTLHSKLGQELQSIDRSLFYNRIQVWQR